MIRSSLILSCVVLGFTFVISGTVSAEEEATQYTVARFFGKNKTYAYDENSVEHGVVLLDFYNDACGPCRSMMPSVNALIQRGYRISKVNTDQFPDWAQRFNITKIPCFIVVVDGKEVARHTGTTNQQNLEAMLVRAGGSPVSVKPEPTKERPVFAQGQSAQSAWRGREQSVAVLDIMEGRYKFEPKFENATMNRAVASNAGSVSDSMNAANALNALNAPNSPENAQISHVSEENSTTVDVQIPANSVAASEMNSKLEFSKNSNSIPSVNSQNLHEHALASTVRIYVTDSRGQQGKGSGTLIDCRSGHALILTCGHLFREYKAGDSIMVDVFTQNGMRTLPAKYVNHDIDRELGLLSITIQDPVETAPVVAKEFRPYKGMPVCTSGCDAGEDPTIQMGVITAQNRYIGAPNIETSALPVQGRSGGGMFTTDGKLLGVCSAADPEDREGIFASYEAIHAYFTALKMESFVLSPRNESLKTLQNRTPEENADTLQLADLPPRTVAPSDSAASTVPANMTASANPAAAPFIPVSVPEPAPTMLEPTVLKEAVPSAQTLSNAEPVAPIAPDTERFVPPLSSGNSTVPASAANQEAPLTGGSAPQWPPRW